MLHILQYFCIYSMYIENKYIIILVFNVLYIIYATRYHAMKTISN